MRTIVLGLGNPYLGDDGVGWKVIEALESLLQGATHVGIETDRVSLGGIALMERLVGYDRVIIVDACVTGQSSPGHVYRLTLGDLPTLYSNSAHDASLKDALRLGEKLGAALPSEVVIYAIEIEKSWSLKEGLSPSVEASVERAARAVFHELGES